MCGIAGIVGAGRGGVEPRRLAQLGDALAHRGPDGHGAWISGDASVGFAHRRLAIIDPDPRSDQPMHSADGSITVTYNGELYNHREVRTELERTGHRFRTSSDTEVLVEALAAWGTDALPRLRGMFAFAAHDTRTGEVVLVRDALGIKPLYHARTPAGELAFASEVRALRPLLPVGLDVAATIDLLLWGSIAAPRTIVAGVRALPAGTLLRIRAGRMTEERWSPVTSWTEDRPGTIEEDHELEECLVEAVRDSVRAHLTADVPVAVFLSSGIDSGVIASIAASSATITALTVRDPDDDESEQATARARAFGLPHRVVDVPLDDPDRLLDDAMTALDQPSVDGVNSFVVARAAAGAGFRVALSGVGGDELFGGYPSATRLPALAGPHRALAPLRHLPVRILRRPVSLGWDRSRRLGRARWAAACAGLRHGPYRVVRGVFAPAEVAWILDADHAEVLTIADERLATIPAQPSSSPYPSATETDQYLRHQLLRDIDATSMASSVEVRTPFVDATLIRLAAGIPQRLRARGPAKALLRSAARHDVPAPDGPKRGFSVPMARWIRSRSARPSTDAGSGPVAPEAARRIRAAVASGRAHWSRAWLLDVLEHEVRRGPSHG